ncbi:MAG: LysM peptidoglycan-binding domain-containing protein, partial [Clostridiaceae bacterium]|nr:LysM peptidoglycan-binding domain-containing protein [Clostridiaceae bacterium]
MDLFRSYQLVDTGDGYDLILYIDTEMNDVEFAEEFRKIDKENKKRLKSNIKDYIKEKFPNVKINAVKVMAGFILLSTFMLGAPVLAKAAESPASSITQTQSAYNYNVKISVNGSLQTFRTRPFIYNNTTYVPLYDFGTAIGASVWWNDSSNTVGINKNNIQIAFMRGSSKARVNGVQVTMPNSIVIDEVTYAPVRFISENLGYTVRMNDSTQTVEITNPSASNKKIHTVVKGDSLWKISRAYGTSVDKLKEANNLTSDVIYPGMSLIIPAKTASQTPKPDTPSKPAPNTGYEREDNTSWPDVTYVVQPGDTVSAISRKFGVSQQDIMRYNYMEPDEWLEAGEKIAISGYAPRVTTVRPNEASAPARRGTAVDWNL